MYWSLHFILGTICDQFDDTGTTILEIKWLWKYIMTSNVPILTDPHNPFNLT